MVPDRSKLELNSVRRPYRLDIFKEIPPTGNNLRNNPEINMEPLYTIKPYDVDGLPSAHRIYMESTTEYEAALKLVGTWEHWEHLLKHSVRAKKLIEGWRIEKDLRDKTLAKKYLWEQAKKGNSTSAKALYEYRQQELAREKEVKKIAIQKAKEQEQDNKRQELVRQGLARLELVR